MLISSSDWLDILRVLDKFIGRRKSELDYESPYQFAVAVLLSAQATDVGVNKATPELFAAAPTPSAMLALGEEGVGEKIRTIGLWRGKARNIVKMSEQILKDFGGNLPSSLDSLMTLAGIGRKSANVIMNEIWDAPTIGVDTHIIRLAGRLGYSQSSDPVVIERDLDRLTPDEYKPYVSNFLVLFGRHTCKAVKPLCDKCPLKGFCKCG